MKCFGFWRTRVKQRMVGAVHGVGVLCSPLVSNLPQCRQYENVFCHEVEDVTCHRSPVRGRLDQLSSFSSSFLEEP
jgi:hypothetical protein